MFLKSKKTPTTLLNQTEIMTIIGEDFDFLGDIKGKNAIRIEGKITGNVSVQKGIILGVKGKINGNIDTEAAVIYGTINGNVKVKQLEIKQTGCINGDIKTNTLGIEIGAQYNGKLEMKNQVTPETPDVQPKNSNK